MTEYRLVEDIDWGKLHGAVAQFEVSDNYVTVVLVREPGKPLVKLCQAKRPGHHKKGVSPNGTQARVAEVPALADEGTPGACCVWRPCQ
jgi:hypothetical protein